MTKISFFQCDSVKLHFLSFTTHFYLYQWRNKLRIAKYVAGHSVTVL